MKQAYMLPIQKQWVDMIRSGVKEYEFRPYALEGKVYIYESLGKKVSCATTTRHLCNAPLEQCSTCYKKYNEGAGAIVGEFVVEECYEVKEVVGGLNEYKLFDKQGRYCDLVTGEYLEKLGHTNQKYAIKISQLKFYDKPIPKEEFVSWSKWDKLNNYDDNTIPECEDCEYSEFDYSCGVTECPYTDNKGCPHCKVTHAPQRAIKVVEREDL